MWSNPSFWCNLSEHQTHAVQSLGHVSYQDIQKVSQRPMGMLICNPCRKSRGVLPSTPEISFLSCVSSSPAYPAGRGLCLTASTLELSVGGGWTRKVKRNMKNAPPPCSRGIGRRVSGPGRLAWLLKHLLNFYPWADILPPIFPFTATVAFSH